MKKTHILLILVFLSLLFQSCQSHSIKNDLEKMKLKGDIIGVKDGYTFYFFNDKGNIEKIIFFEDDKLSNISEVDYNYYVNDNLDKRIEKYRGTSGIISINSIYDNNKHLIKQESSNESIRHYEKFYFYDKNWNLIKDSVLIYDKNSNVTPPSNVVNYNYKNDEIESLEYIIIANGKTHKTILKYKDEIGYFQETEQFSKEITYLKDSKGNWIQRKWKKDGENHQTERIIFYKGQDISEYENKLKEFESNSISNQSNSNNELKDQNQAKQEITCPECKGSGSIECYSCRGSGLMECGNCRGQGYRDSGERCTKCYGDGRVRCNTCRGTRLNQCWRCIGTGVDKYPDEKYY